MKRVGALVLGPLLFSLIATTPARADPSNPPIAEPADPIDLLNVLLTPVFGLADIDPTSLVVTDAEVSSAGVAPAVVALSSSPDFVVDDDLVQCPNAQFTSINAAIIAASPGDTIRVCPGEYNEKVLVNKTLTLEAPRHQGQATQCQAPLTPDPTRVAIIRYPTPGTNPDIGVNVAADGVEIRGFTIEPLTTPPLGGGVGIFTNPLFSGHLIEHNILQRNSTGIYLNSTGALETLARHNCLRNNNFPPLGAAAGNGVYSDQGINNTTIDNNYFTGHSNAAVVIDRFIGTVTFVRITHNSMVDDNSIVIFNSPGLPLFTDITISHNFSSRPGGSAVFVSRGTDRVEVSYNRFEDGAANGISIRNDPGFGAGPPSTNLLVAKNKVTGFASSGIRLGGPAGANTLIQKNKSHGNGLDGIRAGSNTSNYLIDKNHMKFNAEHDCHDDSVGTFNPPALVANPWTDNHGDTENKSGLCKHASTS